jgi:CubicO group peptidase (beta-lactamase class C family)
MKTPFGALDRHGNKLGWDDAMHSGSRGHRWRLATRSPPLRSLLAVFAVTAALTACGSPSSDSEPDAQTPRPPPTDLAPYLEVVRNDHGLPSLAALVQRGDQRLGLAAVGVRKRGDPTPVTVDDRYHIGSNTKAMTATLVALLVEDGVIAWDTTMPEAFPGIPVDPGYALVTIADLLAHRGGAPAEFDLRPWVDRTDAITAQRRAFAAMILGQPPAGPRGGYIYANAGYMIVGAIVEARTGKSWEVVLAERLFTPLGMASCGFGAPGTAGEVDQPWGHTALLALPPGPRADLPPVMGPAGLVHCALADWSRFAAVHLDGARGGTSFLSTASFHRMHTAAEGPGDPYALGWGVIETPLGPILIHFGSNRFWYASIVVVPSANLAVLVATNSGIQDAVPVLEGVMSDLLKTHSGN